MPMIDYIRKNVNLHEFVQVLVKMNLKEGPNQRREISQIIIQICYAHEKQEYKADLPGNFLFSFLCWEHFQMKCSQHKGKCKYYVHCPALSTWIISLEFYNKIILKGYTNLL